MTVPVLWVSRHPEILARGYADQGLFEAILDRSLWRPPGALEFEHHEVRGDFPDGDGALVVLPARHHASPEDVAWFKAQLDRLSWSVVLLSGDEEWVFPWREIPETETRRVWVMQPIPEQAHLSGRIPGGWYPGTHEGVGWEGEPRQVFSGWFFAGQITHERRQQCADVLRALRDADPKSGHLIETEGYLQGIDQSEYWQLVAAAKVIPCPSGPMTVDTARTFEALEAGCVPTLDTRTPRGDDYDYWSLLFGAGHPLQLIDDWAGFPDVLAWELADWPHNSNRVFSFWQQYKRKLAHQLDDNIHSALHASGRWDNRLPGPDDMVTAIVPTSPTPGDPSTDNIVATIHSIRAQLPLAEIVVVCDGVRPEQQSMADDYAEYVRRLLWHCNFRWRNVVPIVMGEWGHQANALRAGLELVTTPQLLFVEHDTPLEGFIDWPNLCAVVQRGDANMIRFHHEKIILEPHKPLMLDDKPVPVHGDQHTVPMMRSAQFWARPHLASTAFYLDRVMPYFGRDSRTMVEDLMYSVVTTAYAQRGVEGWDEWRIWTYTPTEPHMQRSGHLDSRDGAEKFDMVYAYDGDPPPGAPYATRARR